MIQIHIQKENGKPLKERKKDGGLAVVIPMSDQTFINMSIQANEKKMTLNRFFCDKLKKGIKAKEKEHANTVINNKR